MSKCRILIVSGHPLFAEGVGRLISGQAGLQVVSVVSPDEAQASIPRLDPDVVIVDADRATQAVFARMLRANPGVKFIGLSLDNNDINIYYQRNKVSTGVEALVEAIREPLEWKLPEHLKLRVLIVTQGLYGQRIADNIRLNAPAHWVVDQWAIPELPDSEYSPQDQLSTLPPSELIVSVGQSPGAAMLLPYIVEMTGAKGVIAPIGDTAWLPPELMRQLSEKLSQSSVKSVFPKPFCSLTETHYNERGYAVEFTDGPIHEFARYFGQPAWEVAIDASAQVIRNVRVLRDSPCGCARYVAEKLASVPMHKAEKQVEVLCHRFPCLASKMVDSDYSDTLLNVSSRIFRDAFRSQLEQARVTGLV